MIKYTDELINKVKKLFPEQTEMIELAEKGDPYLLMYLKNSWEQISYEEILSATSLDTLKEKAILIQQKVELYNLCITQNYN
jgi:hypothetical protein